MLLTPRCLACATVLWVCCLQAGRTQPPSLLPRDRVSITRLPLDDAQVPDPLAPLPSELGTRLAELVPQLDAFTLADLQSMALANHPAIAGAAARVEQARGRWLQVGLKPNPSAGYVANEVGNEGSGQHGIYINQRFVRGGKLQLNRQVECNEIARRELLLAAVRERVSTDVNLTFTAVLIAQRRVELFEKLLELSRQAEQTTKELLDALEGRRIDYLQARNVTERTVIDVERARNQHMAAWRQLALLVGNPAMPPHPLLGNVEDVPPLIGWDAALERVVDQNPLVAAAVAEVQKANCALARARAETVPDLNTQFNLQRDVRSDDLFVNLQIGRSILIHDRNQGGIRAAHAALIAAESQVETVRLRLRQQLARLYAGYDTAHAQADRFARLILPRARETLELANTSFRATELSFLDLLTAQRAYFRASVDYLDALSVVNTSSQQIEGLLLVGSLDP